MESAIGPDSKPRLKRVAIGRSGQSPPLLLSLVAIAVAGVVLAPIGYLVARAFEADRQVLDLLTRSRTIEVLINTIVLATAVGLTAALIAIPIAWLLIRADVPLARIFMALCALPLVIPSYVGALAYIAAFGPRGDVQQWLQRQSGISWFPSIYGFSGTWLILSLFTFPYVFLTVSASLRKIDPGHEEAARSLGKGPYEAFLTTTLPQLRPAAVSGMLLAALYAVSDFGVVTLLRYDSLTRAIFVQYRSSFDRSYAAVLALLLVVFALVLLLLDSLFQGRAAYYRLGSGSPRKPKRVELGRWRYLALSWILLVLCASLAVPIVVLVQWLLRSLRRGDEFESLVSAAAYSVSLGLLAAGLCLLAGAPIALLSARYQTIIGRITERVVYLGYGLPGIVIGLAFVFLGAHYFLRFYQTTALLVVAYAVRFLPQAVGTMKASLLQISPRLEEAARGLGKSSAQTLLMVTGPLSAPGILAGMALVFLTVVKELPITLLLRPTGRDTLATEIWTAAGSGAFGQAAAPALLLIAVCAFPVMLIFGISRDASPASKE